MIAHEQLLAAFSPGYILTQIPGGLAASAPVALGRDDVD
jgi:hypothetical protein